MRAVAASVRALDPRLKMAVALALGPGLWALPLVPVLVIGLFLLVLVAALATAQPLGRKMVRTLFTFTFFWVAVKVAMDALSGMSIQQVAMGGGDLAIRLVSLLLLGLALALSTSPRSLGLAVSWALRPLIGRESAWKVALSLALMVHFLPICLETMAQVRETFSRRCPEAGVRGRLTIIPLAVLRNLGQKTWNQTLAVAGRGLEHSGAWEPDFVWTMRDTVLLVVVAACGAVFVFA